MMNGIRCIDMYVVFCKICWLLYGIEDVVSFVSSCVILILMYVM